MQILSRKWISLHQLIANSILGSLLYSTRMQKDFQRGFLSQKLWNFLEGETEKRKKNSKKNFNRPRRLRIPFECVIDVAEWWHLATIFQLILSTGSHRLLRACSWNNAYRFWHKSHIVRSLCFLGKAVGDEHLVLPEQVPVGPPPAGIISGFKDLIFTKESSAVSEVVNVNFQPIIRV